MSNRFTQYLSIFICVFLSFSSTIQAQDSIYFLNSTVQLAKVIEITPKELKYKKLSYLDGPVYVLDKKTISRIVYNNGTIDTLSKRPVVVVNNKPAKNVTSKQDTLFINNKKNAVFVSVSDLLVGFISAGYDRQFHNGTFNVRIPVSFGTGYAGIQELLTDQVTGQSSNYSNYGYFNRDKIFSAGIGLNYFPTGQRTFTFGFGPEIEMGFFHYPLYKPLSDNYNDYELTRERGSYNAFMMNAIIYYNISNRISISTSCSMGTSVIYQSIYSRWPDPVKRSTARTEGAIKAGIQLNYKF
jgi:hypothetical protein